jgi:addiction module RelB/DinJ family antitoxin
MTHKYKKDSKRISLWIDRTVKEEAEKIMVDLGLTPTAVVNILYRQIVEHTRIPFEIKIRLEIIEDTNERAIRLMKSKGAMVEDHIPIQNDPIMEDTLKALGKFLKPNSNRTCVLSVGTGKGEIGFDPSGNESLASQLKKLE